MAEKSRFLRKSFENGLRYCCGRIEFALLWSNFTLIAIAIP